MNKVMLTVVAALAMGACAPRMITGIIPTKERVRFVHGDGIVECKVPKAGEAKNCRDLNIQYQ